MGATKQKPIFEGTFSDEQMSKWTWNLTKEDVMKEYNVSQTTVERWMKKGLPFQKRGHVVRFAKKGLYYFMRQSD